MAVVWERSGEAFYADVEAADGTRYDLIVERLRNVSTTLIHPGSEFRLDSSASIERLSSGQADLPFVLALVA